MLLIRCSTASAASWVVTRAPLSGRYPCRYRPLLFRCMNTTIVTGRNRKTRGAIRREARLFPELACRFVPIGVVACSLKEYTRDRADVLLPYPPGCPPKPGNRSSSGAYLVDDLCIIVPFFRCMLSSRRRP